MSKALDADQCKTKQARLELDESRSQVFLTVAETAALLRTTRKGIYAAIERGQLPGVVRLGRRVLVKRAVLERALDETTSERVGK